MKTQHLELILTALAESIESHRRDRAMDVANTIDATSRAMDRLMVIWKIQDVLSNTELTKREKLYEIDALVQGVLNPDADDDCDIDWGYQ